MRGKEYAKAETRLAKAVDSLHRRAIRRRTKLQVYLVQAQALIQKKTTTARSTTLARGSSAAIRRPKPRAMAYNLLGDYYHASRRTTENAFWSYLPSTSMYHGTPEEEAKAACYTVEALPEGARRRSGQGAAGEYDHLMEARFNGTEYQTLASKRTQTRQLRFFPIV